MFSRTFSVWILLPKLFDPFTGNESFELFDKITHVLKICDYSITRHDNGCLVLSVRVILCFFQYTWHIYD